MFCDRCGAKLQGPVSFCPHCGRQFGAAPPGPVVNRVAGHLRNVAVLWLVYAALRLIPGLFLSSFSDWGIPFTDDAPFFVHGIMRSVGHIFLATGVLGVIAGWGLYERRSWGSAGGSLSGGGVAKALAFARGSSSLCLAMSLAQNGPSPGGGSRPLL